MRKLFFMLAVVVATTLSAQAQNAPQQKDREQRAQERPNREEMVEKRQSMLAEKIGLSEDQAKQLLEINSSYITERQILIEAMQRAVQDLEKKKIGSIVELLDDDQMAKYLMMIEPKGSRGGRGQMQEGRGQGRPMQGAPMAQGGPRGQRQPQGEMRGGERPRGEGEAQEGQQPRGGERPRGEGRPNVQKQSAE